MSTVVYYTRRNGGRPFRVEITDESEVKVYSHIYCGDNRQPGDLLFDSSVHHVFIGKSPLCRMTEFSARHGPRFDGNSILLRPSAEELKYEFIGHTTLCFNTEDPIVEFVSPVGNNDVPYPYAIDDKGRTYLMLDRVVLLNTDSGDQAWRNEHDDDPYNYYYRHNLITANIDRVPPLEPLQPHQDIKSWWFGNDSRHIYNMRYTPTPGDVYDDCTLALGPMFIQKHDGTKQSLSKDDYVELIEQVGKERGFELMKPSESHCCRAV